MASIDQYAHGPYHRLAGPTQTARDADEQVRSGELWGTTPRGGSRPAVQAYLGQLPAAEIGIEFRTKFPPSKVNSMSGVAAWNDGAAGVSHKFYDPVSNKDYVGIDVYVTKNTQTGRVSS